MFSNKDQGKLINFTQLILFSLIIVGGCFLYDSSIHDSMIDSPAKEGDSLKLDEIYTSKVSQNTDKQTSNEKKRLSTKIGINKLVSDIESKNSFSTLEYLENEEVFEVMNGINYFETLPAEEEIISVMEDRYNYETFPDEEIISVMEVRYNYETFPDEEIISVMEDRYNYETFPDEEIISVMEDRYNYETLPDEEIISVMEDRIYFGEVTDEEIVAVMKR
jgi:hypothetical protein